MRASENLVRVQATYVGRLGVEVGIFVAVDHLRRAGVLTPQEEATYLDIDDWFEEHLPNPDFYADGNSVGAVTWFRTPVTARMQERVEAMCAILRAHGVAYDVVTSRDPGRIIYSDEFQVGVVPTERRTPTPLPHGVTLRPTTPGSKRAVARSAVRHVLLDADGVLQDVPAPDWETWARGYVGERTGTFFARVSEVEREAYRGGTDFLAELGRILADLGSDAGAREVHEAVWRRTRPVPASLELVDALRRHGYGVHLASNQEPVRAAWMRETFGYDDLVDTSFYSCELGAAKPEPAFYDAVVRRLGVRAEEVLLVDDTAENVTGARAAGLAAVHWTVADGHDRLLALLDEGGVDGRRTVAGPASAQR